MPNHDSSQLELQQLLHKLADRTPHVDSALTEQRLRAACRQRRALRRRNFGLTAVAALIAFLVIAFGLTYQRTGLQTPTLGTEYAGFLALPYAQSGIPLEHAIVIQVDLQPGDLTSLGLPVSRIPGKGRRRADLLIGQDGVARAVRFDP